MVLKAVTGLEIAKNGVSEKCSTIGKGDMSSFLRKKQYIKFLQLN